MRIVLEQPTTASRGNGGMATSGIIASPTCSWRVVSGPHQGQALSRCDIRHEQNPRAWGSLFVYTVPVYRQRHATDALVALKHHTIIVHMAARSCAAVDEAIHTYTRTIVSLPHELCVVQVLGPGTRFLLGSA